MTDTAEKRARRRRILWLILAFVLPVSLAMTVRLCTSTEGEASYDAFYHAGMGKLGPGVFCAKTFPWQDSSIWKTAFADKELLYHTGIFLIFRLQELLGLPAEPPFHFAACFWLLLLSGAWVFAGVRLKLPPPLICIGSLLFAAIAPNWTYRMVMLRPHVVSIAFFLTEAGILTLERFRTKLILTTVLSLVYSWTYSNPHFIVILPLVYACSAWRRETCRVFLLPLLSLGAVFCGLTLHPQFPNSFLIWKIQSWDALVSPMLHAGSLSLPTEMMPPGFVWQLTVIPLYLLAFFNLAALIRLVERAGWKVLPPLAYTLAFLSFAFTGGIFLAMRSIEYAAPLSVLVFLILFDRLLREDLLIPFRRSGPRIPLLICALAAASIASFCILKVIHDSRKAVNRPVRGMAAWFEKHLAPDEAVVNVDWSDFTILFYSDSRHRYQWGLDPVFTKYCHPERAEMLEKARYVDRKPVSPYEVGRMFNCRYAVILYPRIQQASFLAANGWKLREEIRTGNRTEGWIFALDEREAINLPHTRIRPLKK